MSAVAGVPCSASPCSSPCSAASRSPLQQLHATVGWHASVIALTALAIGAPLGIALGRAVWRRYASGLDASAPAETPWIWLAVAVVATFVLANVVAAIPGRSAARTHPAIILRDE